MWSNSLFQAMTMAPEALEPFAALPFALVAGAEESTNPATTAPITTTRPMELATINVFFFISVFSF
jgi:hypothetical protein